MTTEGMTYRERREAKADRLRGWAEKRKVKAAAVFEAGRPYTDDNAFNTQPGHIPMRARIITREDRAYESLQKAHSMAARADGIDRQTANAIYSDDPDAIEALEARITRLEAKRSQIKTANATYRKEHRGELRGLTFYGRDKALPFPSYVLTNLSADINRNKKRLTALKG